MSNPTQSSQRIIAIDVLRGFALLGILVMNIQGFSMPVAAYDNPTAYGDFTGINRAVWAVSHLLTDHKMMNIFSMLFGAGIVLFTERLEQRGANAVRIHYRRTFWLLLIGLAHAYLLWSGDILVTYAVCSFVVVLLRKVRPRRQFILGILSLTLAASLMIMVGLSLAFMPAEQAVELTKTWSPSAQYIAHEVAVFQSGWLTQMPLRSAHSLEMQTTAMLFWGVWRAGGLMLIGMALFKWGVFSAQSSDRTYKRLLLLGFGVGLPLVGIGIAYSFNNNFSFDASRFGVGYQFNYWGSILVSLGYVAGVMLIVRAEAFSRITSALAAVGRMALSNYLLHTLIATILFYGHGFGLFGRVERIGQIMIVFAIWLIQLILSPIWLNHFRFGPAEWLWRSLTYWKLQPFRR